MNCITINPRSDQLNYLDDNYDVIYNIYRAEYDVIFNPRADLIGFGHF